MPVGHVLEVTELGVIRAVPGARQEILGIRNLRGQILPVADLASLLGDPRTTPAGLLLVAEAGGRQAGFAIDEVTGVSSLADPAEETESDLLMGATLSEGDLYRRHRRARDLRRAGEDQRHHRRPRWQRWGADTASAPDPGLDSSSSVTRRHGASIRWIRCCSRSSPGMRAPRLWIHCSARRTPSKVRLACSASTTSRPSLTPAKTSWRGCATRTSSRPGWPHRCCAPPGRCGLRSPAPERPLATSSTSWPPSG